MKIDFQKFYDGVTDSKAFIKAYRYGDRQAVTDIKEVKGLSLTEISCRVKGEKEIYLSSVTADEHGQIVGFGCSCKRGKQSAKQPCKHVLALCYAVEAAGGETSAPQTVENWIFAAYEKLTYQSAFTDEENGVRIVGELCFDETESPFVRFKVGRDKLYVVKDLKKFTDCLLTGEEFGYGEKLSFYHTVEAFSPDSRPIAAFLRNSAITEERAENAGYFEKSCKKLSGALLDILFELYGENGMETDDGERRVTFTHAAVKPHFSVKAEGKQQYTVDFYQDRARLLIGLNHTYLFSGDTIARISPDTAAALAPILTELCGTGKILLSAEQLTKWFANVAPVISPYAEISYQKLSAAKYRPQPLKCGLYIDAREEGVTAELKAFYGSVGVNLFESSESGGETVRILKSELEVKRLILKYFTYENGVLKIEDEEKLYELISSGISELEQVCDIYADEAFHAIKIKRPPSASVGVRLDGELLAVRVGFESGYTERELLEILSAYRAKKKYVRISSGNFVDFSGADYTILEQFEQLSSADTKDILKGEIKTQRYRAMHIDRLLKESGLTYTRDAAFKTVVQSLKSFEDADCKIDPALYSVMRHYQRSGFRWLTTLARLGLGGILADDMGLGKSLQTIAFIKSLERSRPSLIVCPSSLILNWKGEFEKFAPDIKVLCVYGVKKVRDELLAKASEYDVVVTSYELLRQDEESFTSMRFLLAVIDEGQYIKNHTTKNAHAVKAINAEFKFALTGTPIENNLAELWSIFDFVMPEYLYSYSKFKETFENRIVREGDARATELLHKMVEPFILRRLKKQVLLELPPKIDNLVKLPLEERQRDVYTATLSQIAGEIRSAEDVRRNRVAVLSYLTKLREICCSPELVFEDYDGNSAKLEACMLLIRQSIDGGHKVLLFSQFTSMLKIIREKLTENGISYYLLQGDTKKEERMRLVTAFNEDKTPVFLLSLKAGGTGLNLTGADVVIHYDPWWNLSVQNQATDRAHRLGQNKTVEVYRLIMEDTVEEKIVRLQEKKRDLFDTIIRDGETDFNKLSPQQILELLS